MHIQGGESGDVPSPSVSEGSALEDLWDREIIALFRAHRRRLTGYLISLGADQATADDIVQDSFLIARHRWPDVRDFKYPAAYLYKVATRRLRRLHRDWRTQPYADPVETFGHSVAPGDSVHLSPELEATLGMLPRRQHEVILLNLIYGFKISEVAGILCIREGTVKHYLSLGRRRLAELLLALNLDTGQEDGK